MISRSRKSTYNLEILAKALGMNIHENKWLFKEQETTLIIMTAFGGKKNVYAVQCRWLQNRLILSGVYVKLPLNVMNLDFVKETLTMR